jgi:FixJ family two-component response regulator
MVMNFVSNKKKLARIRDIPVVVMTGDSDENMGKDMDEPCGVLIKPLHMNSIIEVITTHI